MLEMRVQNICPSDISKKIVWFNPNVVFQMEGKKWWRRYYDDDGPYEYYINWKTFLNLSDKTFFYSNNDLIHS